MDKDIVKYLHYYLGCEIKAENNGTMTYKLNKIGANGFASFKDKNGFDVWLGEGWKPILRKLESMTEDEASDIYTIERDRILHPPTNDVDVRRVNNAWQIVRLDLLDTILWVTDEAIIYKVTEDNGKPMIEYTRNMPMIFHYLLSRGFWLFGNDWFDEGLIIDKATLK